MENSGAVAWEARCKRFAERCTRLIDFWYICPSIEVFKPSMLKTMYEETFFFVKTKFYTCRWQKESVPKVHDDNHVKKINQLNFKHMVQALFSFQKKKIGLGYCSIFVFIWQILSNYGLTRLKKIYPTN